MKTLEDQAALPIANPSEMGQPSLDAAVAQIAALPEYQRAFRGAFGRPPSGPDLLRAIASAVTNSSNSTADASMTLTDSPNNATNTSNDPATPHSQILQQNYFVPSSDGYDGRSADQQLLKLFLPVKLFGVQNSFRIYQPIATSPLFPDGRNAGFGDTTVYDLALHEVSRFTVGAGPLLVLPVASHKDIGAGKWQAGVAGVVSTKSSFGLIAAVITYQHSFSGYGSDRPEVNLVTVQPFVFYNLKKHYYLRSSGFWNLNYGNHVSQIPVGFGAGKVWTLAMPAPRMAVPRKLLKRLGVPDGI